MDPGPQQISNDSGPLVGSTFHIYFMDNGYIIIIWPLAQNYLNPD